MPKEHKSSLVSKREFLSEEFQDILGNMPQWILLRGTFLILISIILIIIGSVAFKYPDTINTTMTLTGSTPVSELISKSSGKIQELYVLDKQDVKVGQYLAVLANSANTNNVRQLKQYLKHFDIKSTKQLPPDNLNLGDMQTTYSNFYTTLCEYNKFDNFQYYEKKKCLIKYQINEYIKYDQNIKRKESIINEQFKLFNNQYMRDSLLNKRNLISDEALEITNNQYLQSKLSKEDMRTSINDVQIKINQLHENLLDIENLYQERKTTLETKLSTYVLQLLAEIQSWELTNVFLSPIEGKVTFTDYWTENQNVKMGGCVFCVVPQKNDSIIGKAKMSLLRSGKVKTGQNVNIRLLGFPVAEFGVIKGIVTNISMVPVKNAEGNYYYVVEIGLPQGLLTTYNKQIPYLPEMQAQADIITEDFSLLERLLMPIRKLWTDGINNP